MLRKLLAALCGLMLAMACAMAGLAFLLDGAGTSPELMHSMFLRHAPSAATGLPEQQYPAMSVMIAGYLAGDMDAFQLTFTDETGTERICFNEKEQRHMADCRALFILCRKVLLGAAAAAAALGVIAWALREEKRLCARWFGIGCLAVLAALAALGVWGAVDFDSLFVLFHKLSFSNDLWLLDPRTDLLIRLMPVNFFIHYAALIGGTWLVMLLILAATSWRLSTRWKQ